MPGGPWYGSGGKGAGGAQGGVCEGYGAGLENHWVVSAVYHSSDQGEAELRTSGVLENLTLEKQH